MGLEYGVKDLIHTPLWGLIQEKLEGDLEWRTGRLYNGEISDIELPLIIDGALKNTLISTRTANEYNLSTNFASQGEYLRSPVMKEGLVEEQDILKELNTGVYLSNLHYLNWSDQLGGRVTGMTCLLYTSDAADE